MVKKQNPDLDRFGKIIRGFIRSNTDKRTGELIDDPVRWLAIQMSMTEGTIKMYLANPLLLSKGSQALMKNVLKEKLDTDNAVEALTILIESIPARDRNAKR